MNFSDNWPLAPVPAMAAVLEPVSHAVQRWPGVTAAAHWDLLQIGEVVDGAGFHVGNAELGHIHLSGDLHLATSPVLGQALVAGGWARPLRFGGSAYAGWTEFRVATAADAAHATRLLEWNYRRLRGQSEAELVAEIRAHQAASEPK